MSLGTVDGSWTKTCDYFGAGDTIHNFVNVNCRVVAVHNVTKCLDIGSLGPETGFPVLTTSEMSCSKKTNSLNWVSNPHNNVSPMTGRAYSKYHTVQGILMGMDDVVSKALERYHLEKSYQGALVFQVIEQDVDGIEICPRRMVSNTKSIWS